MTILRYSGFAGAVRALHAMLLPNHVGVTSLNQKPGRGDLRPWGAPLTVATVPAGRKTIYRMGRQVASDTQYWLTWATEVHAVLGPTANDTAERTYFTGAGTPKWTNTTMALASAPYPTTARELGVPSPVVQPLLNASGGVGTLTHNLVYCYTYVTDIGEESAPGPVSAQLACKVDDAVAISSLAAPPAGNYGINRIRIYRTSGSADDLNYYFLREISSTLTSSSDDGRVLGEVAPTTTWLTPPADLKFLTGMWNGMLAGISGRSVRVCEAYVPYAWPIAYEVLPSQSTPVALATYGQTLVVLTNGNPMLVTGGTPDALDETPVAFEQACIAPLSTVGLGHGVAWASPDGLAYVGQGGARLLTEGLLTRDDWQAMNPSSIVGCMYERRYFGFFTANAQRQGFVLDPLNPQGIYFLNFGVDALYLDELQDALYVLDGTQLQKWDAGAPLSATFRTKLERLPRPVASFSCAEVTADAYPLTFKLYADGVLKHSVSVTSAAPFRLPADYYAQTFQIELVTSYPVQGVAMAHSMQELAQT
jgi:hypothetical protein